MTDESATYNADRERILSLMARAVGDEKHETSAYSTLDLLWVLYDRVLRYDPANPRAEDRDRFLLSKGHGPAAFYAILADKGFFSPDTLDSFERWESILGAHPDRTLVPGAEVSTGSLGHGLPMAVGMALALRAKHSDRRVFALMGDGECNEGTIWESVLQAGNTHLGNLTGIFANNFSSSLNLGDLAAKLTAFGWHAMTIDGRDHEQIYAALTTTDPARPTAVVALIHQ
ncbi:MAG: Transketolase, N-terminal section [Ktedonobacterales bacterium]|jgi:transketolase|nr:MAG: Transketolase, N-terminal section [Ktedonobacterales bacterium]